MRNRVTANALRIEEVTHGQASWPAQPTGGFTDTHCHCLPAFDDGPASLHDSIALCEALVANMVGTVVATPHFLGSFDRCADAATVREAVDRLNQALRQEDIELAVLPGAEVRVDEAICKLLDDDRILTIGDGGRYLLLGLPHEVFIDIEPVLAELSLRGITALIAHPERNVPLMSQPGVLRKWVERGAAVQITAASLVGDNGPWAERAAWRLVTNGLASVVATDAHDAYRARPRMSAAFTLITEELGRGVASLLCIENPSRVVAGLDIKPVLDDYNAVVNR